MVLLHLFGLSVVWHWDPDRRSPWEDCDMGRAAISAINDVGDYGRRAQEGWALMTAILLSENRDVIGAPSRDPAGTGSGRGNIWFNSNSNYAKSGSDSARLIVHETLHKGYGHSVYPLHAGLDIYAVSIIQSSGLGGGEGLPHPESGYGC